MCAWQSLPLPLQWLEHAFAASSAYMGNHGAGDFSLTFPLSLKQAKAMQVGPSQRLLQLCSTALTLAPRSVYLLPSRKCQLEEASPNGMS